MTPQDWSDLARVFSSGAREVEMYDEDGNQRLLRSAFQGMSEKCAEIADERSRPQTPQIFCRVCRQLKPGPGYIVRDNLGMIRVCDDCNSQHGVSQLLRMERRSR